MEGLENQLVELSDKFDRSHLELSHKMDRVDFELDRLNGIAKLVILLLVIDTALMFSVMMLNLR